MNARMYVAYEDFIRDNTYQWSHHFNILTRQKNIFREYFVVI